MINVPEYRGSLQKKSDMTGIYRARVESNNDPHHLGRVKVRIPMLHGSDKKTSSYIKNEYLPWATPCFMGAGADYGSYIVPEVGEFVLVAFEGGSTSNPVYIGSCYGTGAPSKTFGKSRKSGGYGSYKSVDGQCESPEDINIDNSKKIIYRSIKGSSFEIDDTNGNESISMVDALGQSVVINSNLSNSAIDKKYRYKSRSNTNNGNVQDNTNGADISIIGAYGQKVYISSSPNGDSEIVLDNGSVKVKLHSSGGKSLSNGILECTNGSATILANGNNLVMSNSSSSVSLIDGRCIISGEETLVI